VGVGEGLEDLMDSIEPNYHEIDFYDILRCMKFASLDLRDACNGFVVVRHRG
jgi:hypothetical protein